jgi:uncharacterized membrane protein
MARNKRGHEKEKKMAAGKRKFKLSLLTALLASLVVGGQIVSILLQGKTSCLNEGCEVAEQLIRISPLSFNLLGLVYFQTLFWVFFFAGKSGKKEVFLPSLLLLAGLGVEGVLLSYQMFAVLAFCSYCLIIAGLVVLLNILLGWRQIFSGAVVFSAVLTASSLLNFGPALLLSRSETLDAGVYAVRPGVEEQGRYYLFLSATCPHCQTVLEALPQYPGCTVFINPVTSASPDLSSMQVELRGKFSSEVSRLFLALLDLKEIPMLLEDSGQSYTLYRGEQDILHVLKEKCSGFMQGHNEDSQKYEGMSLPDEGEGEGECGIETECVQ